jgi:ATP-dependent helicase/nuclease subunit A
MNSPAFSHVAIAASAGTGKTYALAHRYIALVQRGVPPDRICALTFSRKAAGEIFDEIIRHICNGAGDATKARESSREIGVPLQPADFAVTLRRVVDQLHRLHIGTIDSFVVGVVRAFPFELGIAPDFRIGDNAGAAADEIRRTLFGRLFDPDATSEPVRQAFLEAFKLATFGQEHKSLGQTLERFIADLAGIHRRIPSPQAWGQPLAIWGGPLPWPRLSADQRVRLAAAAATVAWPDAAASQHAEMVAFLRDYDDQREWPAKMESRTLFPRLWQALVAPAGKPLAVKFGKQELLLPAPATDALRQLAGHAMAVELDRTLRQTRGVESVLALYETLYKDYTRRSGQLGFDDLARLVAGGAGLPPSSAPDKPDHLFINYRLDAVLDHWLLDEFQDTSDLQWRVLGNLIDETVQDDSGTRSFFYVGDVKQAIYGWRGGNHRLFGQVQNQYGAAIATIHRNVSFRSSPFVIDALNRIFGALSADDRLPPTTLANWQAVWREHVAARKDLPGAVELIEAAPREDERDDEARYRAIATRLAAIDPVSRGLQAAVLLRTNDQARRCADLLRAQLPGTPVALEGQASLLDNPLVPLLLSLVRFAAHPGDLLAWRHVQMSPLGGETVGLSDGWTVGPSDNRIFNPASVERNQQPTPNIADTPFATPRDLRGESCHPPSTIHHPPDSARSSLSLALLSSIHRDGFQPTLRDWCARIEATCPLDTFTRLRRDDLLDAAAGFDATGDRDCDRFARFIEGYTRHDSAAETAIRVMTIHQSKGLGFDLVCVPFDPASESFDNPGRADMLEEEHGRWVLKAPRQLIVESDPVLDATAARQLADAAFAKLCVFYVSLTRAKQGLVLVVSPPPKTSAVVREDTLLRTRFAGNQSDSATVGQSGSRAVGADRPPTIPDGRQRSSEVRGQNSEANQEPRTKNQEPSPPTLSILYSTGNSDWHLMHELRPKPAASAVAAQPPAPLSPGAARLKRVEPSQHDPGVQPAASFFQRESGDVRVFGSAIHRLFQQIEWIETFDAEQAVQAWRATATEPMAVLRDVEQQFRKSLASEEVRQALSREHAMSLEREATEKPEHTANNASVPSVAACSGSRLVLWREKAFELLHEGQLLAGQFDRVVIHRGPNNKIERVSLFDFKSNRVESEAALHFTVDKYRDQMALYAAALRHILGPAPITTCLVFTRVGRVVEL